MKKIIILAAAACVVSVATGLWAVEKTITIIHSNDLHSHLLGFSPNIDYTPQTGDDLTLGGFARLATIISKVRLEKKNPVLVVDAGDFLMGSLFHMRCREKAMELQLMAKMGYDVIAIGNHEFDLKPTGLARILRAATGFGKMPVFLNANIHFSKESAEDDTLEQVCKQGILKPYTVIVKDGIKIGLFGIIGKDAAEVAPFADPVTFDDPVETAKKMVKTLREKEKVDMVVAVSHSGLKTNPSESEDQILARTVPGINVIVCGHTHTKMTKPIIENGTIIVQSWEFGKQLGVLDVRYKDGATSLVSYNAVTVDDSVASDPAIMARIRAFIDDINNTVLKEHKLSFYQTVAETDFDLKLAADESNLGNLVTDSIRWYVNKVDSDPKDPSTRVAVAIESVGVIWDNVLKGKTGKIAVCDLFSAFPLGIGWDDTMGYPLVTCYLNASEIKKAMEVLTSIYPIKGSDYYLQVSGMKFTYNPNRVIFDRVTGIWLQDEKGHYNPLDYSSGNKKLYRIAANIYNTTFLKIIGSFTMNILNIVPKDKYGRPISDLSKFIVDADPLKDGMQEMKEWKGLMLYTMQFPDTDGNGIPNIPEEYRSKQGRIIAEASWNPVSLLSGGTWLTWTVFGIVLIVLIAAGLAVYKISSIIRRRAASH